MRIILVVVFVFISASFVEARSGCCSHHGGVCGCTCCDGNPLSAKCAPYYPQCSGSLDNKQFHCINRCLAKQYSKEDCKEICNNGNIGDDR